MACPALTTAIISSPNGIKGKLPGGTEVRIRCIAQGPHPRGFSPDMPAPCQKTDITLKWTLLDDQGRVLKPRPQKTASGSWGYWFVITPVSGNLIARADLTQKSSGVALSTTKTWPLK